MHGQQNTEVINDIKLLLLFENVNFKFCRRQICQPKNMAVVRNVGLTLRTAAMFLTVRFTHHVSPYLWTTYTVHIL